MKARCLHVCFVSLSLLALPMVQPCVGTVLTFDDLSGTSTGSIITNIPSLYHGLVWSNMWVINAVLDTTLFGTNGAYYGMVSPSNMAFNGAGFPAEVDSAGTNFNFLSAYLTGAWNSNLIIEVEGFRSGALVYDQTVIAAATNSTLFMFNYMNIDRLYFNSFGGQGAFGTPSVADFVMDNFDFDFIPEPSSLLLATFGALLLWPLLKRERA
jgi:hypothetical protein